MEEPRANCQTSTMKRIAIILFVVGCTTTSGVIDKSQPQSTASFTTGAVSPAAGSQLTKASVFSAQVTWSIENFQPNAGYYIAPVFASKEGENATFNMAESFEQCYRVRTASGSATIGYPVARELDSPQLSRPVRIWLLLMERTGEKSTRIIRRVGPFEYR